MNLGSVHVFGRSGDTWFEEANIFAPDGQDGDLFGRSVAISNQTIIVGTYGHGAYIFALKNGAWLLQGGNKLTNSPSQNGDLFGFAVAISGDTAIVGALGDKKDADGYSAGSATIFQRTGEVWNVQQKLEGQLGGDRFGLSVGISGNFAVVGSENLKNPNYTTPEYLLRQYVFTYVRKNGTWSLENILGAKSPSAPGDSFGSRVAINGQNLIVAAPGEDNTPNNGERNYDGAAYIFNRNSTGWVLQQRVAQTNPAPYDAFANSVAISSGTAIVGGYSDDVGTSINQGAAYAYLGDTDGDGLPDDWERNGVTIDGEFINLPKMGADPLHKDIFVHVDWMSPSPSNTDYRPNTKALKLVTDALAIAPVENPDRKPGITLHVDAGPNSIMIPRTRTKWGAFSRAGVVPFQAGIEPNATVPL